MAHSILNSHSRGWGFDSTWGQIMLSTSALWGGYGHCVGIVMRGWGDLADDH